MGILRGDLNPVQRATLTYLMMREKSEKAEDDFEQFKQRMMAANPEYMDEIAEDFDRIQSGEYADQMTDEEMDEAGPLDANSLEYALAQMRSLGIGMDG